MKKFRKLIPAMCMLLISAVLVGTSTFAWFSMQETVTVTGLQVTAKTDQPYLIIDNTETTVTGLQTLPAVDKGSSVDFKMTADNSKLNPVAHEVFTDATVIEATKEVGSKTVLTNWYWHTAQVTTATDAKNDEDALKIEFTDFGKYVIKQTVYMTIVKDTPTLSDITATVTIAENDTDTNGDKAKFEAARVILATYTNTKEYTDTSKGTAKSVKEFSHDDTTATSLECGEVVSTGADTDTIIKVDIYIYIDGADKTIFTDNIAKLESAKIDIAFTAVVKAA